MENHDVVRVQNLSKCFRIYNQPIDYVKEMLFHKSYSDAFWALRDISFTIQHRQRLGIIGPNGSGKSTLLRLITGNLEATTGQIELDGKISAMLSLNSMLNSEETGYKNIRFNLLINGCPRERIDEKLQEIIDFAELGPFIYKPVKTYSSGMVTRLSFAITTALEPDILVVDEVLSVGDAYFNGKAMKRMLDVCNRGRALIFVSHSIADICRLCDTVMWLDHGRIREYGPARDVVKKYEEDYRRQEDLSMRDHNRARMAEAGDVGCLDEADAALFRLRLCPDHGKGYFASTHYVRRLTASAPAVGALDLPLGAREYDQHDSWFWPDLLGCEWGRIYEHAGVDCRLLYAQTGRKHGGQLLVRKPDHLGDDLPLDLAFETAASDDAEKLIVQAFDLERKGWVAAEVLERVRLSDGWQRVTCRAVLRHLAAEHFETCKQAFYEEVRPNVEIDAVEVHVNNQPRYVIGEREPFEVRIRVKTVRSTPCADVALKIMRADGVYVFWQSSGQVTDNLTNFDGAAWVVFTFDPNLLGAGQYLLSVSCNNGWNLDDNYPYSEVFDRKVNICQITVNRADPRLDCGQLNMLVPVRVVRENLALAG